MDMFLYSAQCRKLSPGFFGWVPWVLLLTLSHWMRNLYSPDISHITHTDATIQPNLHPLHLRTLTALALGNFTL